MIWHEHLAIGVHESGSYTVRRVTHGYETWYRTPKEFYRVGNADRLKQAKEQAEIHAMRKS